MELYNKYYNIINNEIMDNILKYPYNLYEPIIYLLQLGGKRIRPIILMIINHIYGGNDSVSIKPALAIELFHNFSLIHDDIIDNSKFRRGNKSIYYKYGINQAVLSGDVLLLKSYILLNKLPANLLKICIDIFSKMAINICEGQQLDIDFKNMDNVSQSDYINMIYLKTACLIGTTFKLGYILSGYHNNDASNLYKIGVKIGICYQIKDDYLDLFSDAKFGKKIGGDIIERKKNILYIKAMELLNQDDKKKFIELYRSPFKDEKEICYVKKILQKYNIDKCIKELICSYVSDIYGLLHKLSISDYQKITINKLVNFIINRNI